MWRSGWVRSWFAAAWLASDLAANANEHVIAYWHHPRFSSGTHGNDTSTQGFWDLLYQYGAEVVLVGHDHDYERFGPQDPFGGADSQYGSSNSSSAPAARRRGPSRHSRRTARFSMAARGGCSSSPLVLELRLAIRAGRREDLHRLRHRRHPWAAAESASTAAHIVERGRHVHPDGRTRWPGTADTVDLDGGRGRHR